MPYRSALGPPLMRECLRQLGFLAVPKTAERVWPGADWSRERTGAGKVTGIKHSLARQAKPQRGAKRGEMPQLGAPAHCLTLIHIHRLANEAITDRSFEKRPPRSGQCLIDPPNTDLARLGEACQCSFARPALTFHLRFSAPRGVPQVNFITDSSPRASNTQRASSFGSTSIALVC